MNFSKLNLKLLDHDCLNKIGIDKINNKLIMAKYIYVYILMKALFQIRDSIQINYCLIVIEINSNELVSLVGELEIEQMELIACNCQSSQQVPHIMSIYY